MNAFIDAVPVLLEGLHITLFVLIGSAILGYSIAFIAGFGRLARLKFLRGFTMVYVEFFRGTSLIVQMFWFFFVLSFMPAYWAGVLAISLNYGAYMSEIVRGSILAVDKGQTEAATALNMSRWQRMRLVIFPQALRMMLPEFGNYLIQMLKATSLVSLVSLADITYNGTVYQGVEWTLALPVYSMMLVMYFLIALPLIGLTRWLEKLSSKGVASS